MIIAIKTDPITNFFENMKKLNHIRNTNHSIEINLNDRMYSLLLRYAMQNGMSVQEAASNLVIHEMLEFAAYDQTLESRP
ncbi:hypothetical protein EG832_05005 [bacterium]|nr:hypothetical protein [bacterium]